MNADEQRLWADLRAVPLPADLVPPPDLADTAVAGARRQRVRTVAVAVMVAVLAIATGITFRPGAGGTGFGPAAPTAPVPLEEPFLPLPGGGPVAIHSFLDPSDEHTYVLDPRTGEYDEYPYPVILSPDLTRAAIMRDDKIGVVARSALGAPEPPVDWTTLPPGNGLCWSPDGKKLLLTAIEKVMMPGTFIAYAYDIETKETVETRVGDSDSVASTVGWAADSTDYLVSPVTPDNTGFTFHGLRRVAPDGRTVTTFADVAGGFVGGADSYSPDRKYLIVDPTPMMTDRTLPAQVLDVATGSVVRSLPDGAVPVGWYDATTVAYRTGGDLVMLGLDTSRTRRIDAAGLATRGVIRLGPGADGPAEARGF